MNKIFVRLARDYRVIRAFVTRARFIYLLLNLYYFMIKRSTRIFGPVFAQIEPTDACNLSCRLCIVNRDLANSKYGFMDPEIFRKFIDENSKSIAFLVLYNRGEPFLHKDIIQMIDYAASQNIFVKVSTNALFINKDIIKRITDSKLDELLITLDFPERLDYADYKGKDTFEDVVENIRLLMEARKNMTTPLISLQLLLTRVNENKVTRFKELAGELNVDQLVYKKLRINRKEESGYLPEQEKFVRKSYLNNGNKLSNLCVRPWISATVLWDGTVVPCCFDAKGEYELGNIKEFKMDNIYNGNILSYFRHGLLGSFNTIPLCARCNLSNYFSNFNHKAG